MADIQTMNKETNRFENVDQFYGVAFKLVFDRIPQKIYQVYFYLRSFNFCNLLFLDMCCSKRKSRGMLNELMKKPYISYSYTVTYVYAMVLLKLQYLFTYCPNWQCFLYTCMIDL